MKTRILRLLLSLVIFVGSVDAVLGQQFPSDQTGNGKIESSTSVDSKVKRRGTKGAARLNAGTTAAGGAGRTPRDADGLAPESAPVDTSSAQATKPVGDDGTGDPFQSPGNGENGKMEVATFGAGCFWHVEAEFEWLPGVKSAVSGYSGGSLPNPTYDDVHDGWTGHAEVVRVEYDPAVISYERLLKVFWSGHDPTQLNRQGPDFGTQYRSVIFYHTPEQKNAALKSYQDLTRARVFQGSIVTQLVAAQPFFAAETYHQNYYGGKDDRNVLGRRSKRPRKSVTGFSITTQKNGEAGGAKNGQSVAPRTVKPETKVSTKSDMKSSAVP